MSIKLEGTLEGLHERTKEKFAKKPKVIVKDDNFDVENLPIGDTWHRLTDVVAVVFDMLASTNLEQGRKPASTASIYDAGVGGVVRVFNTFDADFVDIQGDGGFALFWGERRYERAVCAAVTIRKFSLDFAEQLKDKWPDAPSTGFKVGVASGPVLAKKVGLERHLDLQEPVWAGRPVNFAAKSAQQQTDAKHLVITASVWDAIENNDYLTFSCGCPGGTVYNLWSNIEIDKIPGDERYGQVLDVTWCAIHGEDFCNAILDGQKRRDDVDVDTRSARTALGYGSEVRAAAARSRVAFRKQLEQDRENSQVAELVHVLASRSTSV